MSQIDHKYYEEATRLLAAGYMHGTGVTMHELAEKLARSNRRREIKKFQEGKRPEKLEPKDIPDGVAVTVYDSRKDQ